jgi:hypothetical protein
VKLRNPKADVVDAISELVDEQLAHGPTDDYRRPFLARCERCGGEWHGLPDEDCPGAYGTEHVKPFVEVTGPGWQYQTVGLGAAPALPNQAAWSTEIPEGFHPIGRLVEIETRREREHDALDSIYCTTESITVTCCAAESITVTFTVTSDPAPLAWQILTLLRRLR